MGRRSRGYRRARAREADPAFTADDADTLAAVSRHLDGLPLRDRARRRPRPHTGTHRPRGTPRRPFRSPQRCPAGSGHPPSHGSRRSRLELRPSRPDRTRGLRAARGVPRPLRVGGCRRVSSAWLHPTGTRPYHVGVVGRQVDGRRRREPGRARFSSPRAASPVRQRTPACKRFRRRSPPAATPPTSPDWRRGLDLELRGRGTSSRPLHASDDPPETTSAPRSTTTARQRSDVAVAVGDPPPTSPVTPPPMCAGCPVGLGITALDLPGASDHPLRPDALLAVAQGEPGARTARPMRSRVRPGRSSPSSEPGSEQPGARRTASWPRRSSGWADSGRHCRNGRCLWSGTAEITDATLDPDQHLPPSDPQPRSDPPIPTWSAGWSTTPMTYGNPTCLALAWHTAGVILGRDDSSARPRVPAQRRQASPLPPVRS